MGSETSQPHWSDLPQITEYSLLKLEETKFILADLSWLYEIYNYQEEEIESGKISLLRLFRDFSKLEDFIHICLTNNDTDFIYDFTTVYCEEDVINQDTDVLLTRMLEVFYHRIRNQVEADLSELPESGIDKINLIGFFRTTAVLAVADESIASYPTFAEMYGDLRIKKHVSAINNNTFCQTLGLSVSGELTSGR